jgi:hypothetical protein
MKKRQIEIELLKLEILADELKRFIEKQSEERKNLQEVVRFLSENDKFDVIIDYGYSCPQARYLHDMEIHIVDIPCPLFDAVFVKENNSDSCILHTSGAFDSYFKLDKHKKTIVDITNIYRKEDNENGVQ